MTIWKTKAHKQNSFLTGFRSLAGFIARVAMAATCAFGAVSVLADAPTIESASNRFECLRGMMPLTEAAGHTKRTSGIEPPFLIGTKYMAFAETRRDKVVGFYIYDHARAWYYDAVDTSPVHAGRMALKDLRAERRYGVFELTAQPNGLETIAIAHLPGFDPVQAATQATAILGASVLPVVGAFIPHPPTNPRAYHDPSRAHERDVETWFGRRLPGGADKSGARVGRTILRLATEQAKNEAELWAPLDGELEIRRRWIQKNNIDLATFKKFNAVLKDICR